MLEQLIQWDTELFLFLNGLHNSFFDFIMWWASDKEIWYPLYGLILFFVFKKFNWQGVWVFLAMVLVVTIADQSSVKIFKEGFERLRPSHNPAIKDMIHHINNYKGGQYGFVSSHAANTVSFAVFTAHIFRNMWVSAGLYFWAAFVSYSRIYLGVHYPGDIIGGAVLGIIIGYLVYIGLMAIMRRIPEKYSITGPMYN